MDPFHQTDGSEADLVRLMEERGLFSDRTSNVTNIVIESIERWSDWRERLALAVWNSGGPRR